MFSVLPQLASAQKNNPCPPGYRLICHRDLWGVRQCWCYHNGNGKIIGDNATSQQSIASSFELEHAPGVSIKIYDATGRLIRSIVNGKMSENYDLIQWDHKDESGKAVSAGIYVLQIGKNDKWETKKLSVIN